MFLQISRKLAVHACQRPLPTTYHFCSLHSTITSYKRPDFSRSASIKLQRYIHTTKCKDNSLQTQVKEALSVFKTVEFNQLKCAPLPAILYGFGGIIPFVFPPLYFLMDAFSPFLATSQLMYGATILAFVGGVKWGNAVAKSDISHEQIGFSTIPSLVAWSALLVPEPIGYLIVSSGLVGALYLDLTSSGYQPWFNAIRTSLTGIAVTSLMTTFLCHLLH